MNSAQAAKWTVSANAFRIIVLILGLSTLLSESGPAFAQQESCGQCKFLRCLKSTIERKERLIEMYEGLYKFWEHRHTDNNGNPMMIEDLGKLSEPDRSRIYEGTMAQLNQFAKMEKFRGESIPSPEGCGYPGEEMEVVTDTFRTCEITGLDDAMKKQPCVDLANLIRAHEVMHAQLCEKRKEGKRTWRYTLKYGDRVLRQFDLPPLLVTPAGHALEEIAAYQEEVDRLKRATSRLEDRCRNPRRDYTSSSRHSGPTYPPSRGRPPGTIAPPR